MGLQFHSNVMMAIRFLHLCEHFIRSLNFNKFLLFCHAQFPTDKMMRKKFTPIGFWFDENVTIFKWFHLFVFLCYQQAHFSANLTHFSVQKYEMNSHLKKWSKKFVEFELKVRHKIKLKTLLHFHKGKQTPKSFRIGFQLSSWKGPK